MAELLPNKPKRGIRSKHDGTYDHNKIIKEGIDRKTGRFKKGNQLGKIAHKRDGIRHAVADCMTDAEAAKKLRKLIDGKNATVAFKALELWFAYAFGRPIKTVETENVHKFEDSELPEAMQELLDEFEKRKNDDDVDEKSSE